MKNKEWFYNLRLTMSEHLHTRRAPQYRPPSRYWSLYTHGFLALLVVMIFRLAY